MMPPALLTAAGPAVVSATNAADAVVSEGRRILDWFTSLPGRVLAEVEKIYDLTVGKYDLTVWPFHAMLGGIGNPWGIVAATIIVVVVPEKLQTIQEYRFLLYAAMYGVGAGYSASTAPRSDT